MFRPAFFDILVTFYDVFGNVQDQQTLSFTGHTAHLVSRVFDSIPDSFFGMVRLESPSRTFVTVLRQELESAAEFQLTSIPPDTSVP